MVLWDRSLSRPPSHLDLLRWIQERSHRFRRFLECSYFLFLDSTIQLVFHHISNSQRTLFVKNSLRACPKNKRLTFLSKGTANLQVSCLQNGINAFRHIRICKGLGVLAISCCDIPKCHMIWLDIELWFFSLEVGLASKKDIAER